MALQVGELFAKLSLDSSSYDSSLDSAKTKLNGMTSGIKAFGVAAVATTAAAALAAGAATIKIGKDAINAYADYEQLIGGVDTLFKDSSQALQNYAKDAYMTAGVSANQYMDTVTSFSASLIQSLGGDTVKAVEYANMAITDMSDNANKMGTNMGMIENAYQGFAKQNYTMLDNLKLGYGGTKTEMQRLLSDASAISGITYDVSSYADVVEAIHIIQDEMGVTGTTALEAEHTITGSIMSMKGAYQNLLVGFGDADADIKTLVGNVMTSFKNVMINITPIIENIAKALPDALELMLPTISKMLPDILKTIGELFDKVLQAIMNLLPSLIPIAVNAVLTIVDTLIANLPLLINAAFKIMGALAIGLLRAIPQLVKSLPQIVTAILEGIGGLVIQFAQVGKDIIDGLWDGLKSKIEWLKEKAAGIADALPAVVKKILGIESPSKVFAEIGGNVMIGLGEGIADNHKKALSPLQKVTDDMLISIKKSVTEMANSSSVLKTQTDALLNSVSALMMENEQTILSTKYLKEKTDAINENVAALEARYEILLKNSEITARIDGMTNEQKSSGRSMDAAFNRINKDVISQIAKEQGVDLATASSMLRADEKNKNNEYGSKTIMQKIEIVVKSAAEAVKEIDLASKLIVVKP